MYSHYSSCFRYVGSQALLLNTSLDRILALKNLTSSIHILLSRVTVLNVLSMLSLNTNYADLVTCLELVGLSDVRKLVRLMILTAMNRIEVGNIQILQNSSIVQFPKIISHFGSNMSQATNSCLNYLSISIAALSECDVESSNLIVNICTKDLTMSACGVTVPKSGFVVTQALVNILSLHGGCSLIDLTKEMPLNQKDRANVGPLTLINALSAYILSKGVDQVNKEWAAHQLYTSLATKIQIMTGLNLNQTNFADLSGTIPAQNLTYIDGHDNRVSTLAWHEKCGLLASAGYDGTIKLWSMEPLKQLMFKSTLVFHTSADFFGNDLQGRHIGHLKWSATGEYIAAALDNFINIWNLKTTERYDGYNNWFIDDQKEFITAMTWPKNDNEAKNNEEYLLIGKIDGSVSLIAVQKGEKREKILQNYCLPRGKLIFTY